jgi:hypothetical protein
MGVKGCGVMVCERQFIGKNAGVCKFKIDKNGVLKKNEKKRKNRLELSPKIQGLDMHPLKVVTITPKTGRQNRVIISWAYGWWAKDK